MATALLVAAALLAHGTSSPPVIWQDGLAAEILSRQAIDPDLATMSQTVSSGLRDPDWSAGAEADLADRYNAVANFRRDIDTTSIRCAADLCEVAGIMRSTSTGDDLFELMLALQTLGRTAPVAGLHQVTHAFSTATDRPPAFIAYWRRVD